MDLFTRQDLKELLQTQSQPCVSIYIPTHRRAPEHEQDPIRFKNALQRARRQLEQRDVNKIIMQKLLQPAEAWLKEEHFWQHQSDGLATFLTPEGQQRFRLPREFEEYVLVADHFSVTPLLPLLHENGTYYVLAVSQNSCRLFVGDRDRLQAMDEAQLPDSLSSALGWLREGRELNLHSMEKRPQTRGGDETAMYHGHYEDPTKKELEAYFQRINTGIKETLKDEQVPLVFAGVDYLFPIYRHVNTYAGLCDDHITGNFDASKAKELHEKAWKIVAPRFALREQELFDRYSQGEKQEMATTDVGTVLRAARDGLVETLMIARDAHLRGRFDEKTGDVSLAESDADDSVDLLEKASLLTLKSNGDVLPLKMESISDGALLRAMLRVPVSAVATGCPDTSNEAPR